MKYIDADKLKAEIERRKLQNRYIDTDGYEQELFEIIDSLQQEQQEEPDKSLEEEAEEWAENEAYGKSDAEFEMAYKGFIAGAKWQEERNKTLVKEAHDWGFGAGSEWQKQHDAELIEIAYNDGITIGMTKQKEQMLKDAVEGLVGVHLHDKRADVTVNTGYLPEKLGIKGNSKVKVIIVKED